MDTPPSANLRSSRTRRAVLEEAHQTGAAAASSRQQQQQQQPNTAVMAARSPPYLPTRTELAALAVFPAILLFGSVFSLLSPETRRSVFHHATQAHAQAPELAPSYFAQKSNVVNVFFVKRGWFWNTLAYFAFLLTHPHTSPAGPSPSSPTQPSLSPPSTSAAAARRARLLQGGLRWALVTGWWFLVTQWCFGPAIIDRSFRWTGGKCEIIEEKVESGEGDGVEVLTAVACKAAGGSWRGGHDISGHVFLLVLATAFLAQEVGWVVARYAGRWAETRTVLMTDGAVKSASVEAQDRSGEDVRANSLAALGIGGKMVGVVVVLNVWMLLMTAIYFHTWFEKLTGLITAILGLYAVYVVPRFVPAVRQAVGLPGI